MEGVAVSIGFVSCFLDFFSGVRSFSGVRLVMFSCTFAGDCAEERLTKKKKARTL